MKRIIIIFGILAAFSLINTNIALSKQKVYVISVSGNVEPGMAAFLKRALASADTPDPLFVLELDTFGGRVDSALLITNTLLNVSKGKTIAFVKTKAISAGALIALACNELVMKQHTTIGDCAPITYSQEGPKMMGEKFQSPLRAKFRSLAKRNGYSPVLAESMVTEKMAVYEIKKDGQAEYIDARKFDELSDSEKEKITSKRTVVEEGELLTMDATEALALGFSKMTVTGLDDLLTKLDVLNYEIIKIEETWSETLVRFITTIAPILMMIGLAALYMEIKSPGFGVPGIIGICCLGMVFFSQYLVGMADYTELLLLITGIVLLGIELFVLPGFGFAGLAGILFMAAGMILALQDFVLPDPAFPWQAELLTRNIVQVLGAALAAFILSMLAFRYLLPQLATVVNGPYLGATLNNAHADSKEVQDVQVGDNGVALSFLRPSGKAEINGARSDVVTEAEFIEKGTPIIVSAIDGNRIIISRKENE
ncbi:NfeD family protein [Desulfococcaceae bacterium HSG9]|nr:NfeD family protein [Desulfococcaceae bacterium HSG9]